MRQYVKIVIIAVWVIAAIGCLIMKKKYSLTVSSCMQYM